MEELIKSLEKEINILKENYSKYNIEEINFFERINKFSNKNLYEISNIDPTDVLLASIMSLDSSASFSDLKYKMERIVYIDNFNLNDIVKIFEVFHIFYEKDALYLLKSENVSNKTLAELNLERDFDGFIEILNVIFSNSRNAMNILLDLYEKYDKDGIFEDLILFCDFKRIIESKEEFEILNNNKSEDISLQLSKHLINDFTNGCKVFDIFKKFKSYSKKLIGKTSLYKLETFKLISAYTEIKKSLESNSKNIKTDELKAINPSIALNIIKYLSQIMDEEYQIEKEKFETNNNELSKLNQILYKYDINFLTYEEKMSIITSSNFDDIEEMISIVISLNINTILNDKDIFLETLLSSSKTALNNINKLIKAKIISNSFLERNIGILFTKECELLNILPKYNDLATNIEILTSHGIPILNLKKYNINVLINNPVDLNYMLDLSKMYTLDLTKDELYNFSMLEEVKTFDILDQLIEEGVPITSEILIDIKKNDSNLAKRCKLAKELGINTLNNGKINPIITSKNSFYVDDDSIDKYIINNTPNAINKEYSLHLKESKRIRINPEILNIPEILEIEKNYKKDNISYDINGITISRIKFLRNITSLTENFDITTDIENIITTSILYGSILNSEEINRLSIKSKTKEKTA